MIDIEEFDDVFFVPSSSDSDIRTAEYGQGLVRTIYENKMQLGGRTFFERLLELLSIKWRKIYPPETPAQLRDLHARIVAAQTPLHYKHCLFFYLLKDLSSSHHGETELATAFARGVHLEKRFWTFVEGIWALDHLQYETAVEHLTHPSILPTFPDEIMGALLHRAANDSDTSASRRGEAGTKIDILPLAYYHCAKPPLVKEDVKTEFVKYLATRNVTETFSWIRTRPSLEQPSLLETFVKEVLEGPAWSADKETVYDVEQRAIEFVGLPLNDDEEVWIEKYLTEDQGRNLRHARDTVLMRRMASGRLLDAANEPPGKSKKIRQVDWEVLKDGVKTGLGSRDERESPFKV